jgi:hypothetical protein
VNAVVLPGDELLGSDTPDGYFWFNEANAEKVNEILADGIILGDSISFDPAKEITFNDQLEAYPVGVITVKKSSDIIFHLPSCSEFKAYLTRTGSFSGDVFVSDNGIAWTKVKTLSGAKGKLELDLTAEATSASDVYIKILNTSTGGLNIHGVKILLAAPPKDNPGEGGEQPGVGGEQPGEGGEQPGEGGEQPGEGGEQPTTVEQTSIAAVTIYPNPAKGSFNLVNNGGYTTAQILSLNGSVVYTHPIATGSNFVNVSFLKSGVYLVRLLGAQGKAHTVKVIVK